MSKGKNRTLNELLSLEKCPAVLLLVGPDEVRKNRVVTKFLSRFREVGSERVVRLNCADFKLSNLINLEEDLTTFSLFETKRFWHLTNVEQLSKEGQQRLSAIVENGFEDSLLVLDAASLPKNNALFNLCRKKELVLELEKLKGERLRAWLQKELKGLGIKQCAPGVLESIIELGDGELDRILPLAEQLSLYVDGDQLTNNDIAALFSRAPDSNEFELISAFTSGQQVRAELLLQNILRSGKNPFALLGLLSRTFSQYLKIKIVLTDKKLAANAQEELGMSSWLFDKSCRAARRYSSKALMEALKAILVADSKLKNRSLGAESIFSELTGKLLARQ